MGFRDFHGFNLAMLGKQGWKFQTNPDAMITKVFKAKYFLEGDFLGATLGNNPSFVWRSIWSSQKLVNEGYRWRVGNGAAIEVWSSSWLRSIDSPRIQSPKPPHTNVHLVCDLIDTTTSTWKASAIAHLFLPGDAQAILSIPLVNLSQHDAILWRYEKHEHYTVKSAYRVYMDRLLDRNELRMEGDWRWPKIWSLNVPPKVRTCVWRACRDCLPTRLAIRSRGVVCTPLCVVCNKGNESYWHLFLTCPASVHCWRKCQLWSSLESVMPHVTNFREVFFQLCRCLTEEHLSIFSMLVWSIWKMRNHRLWENTAEQPDQILHRAESMLFTWKYARGQRTQHPFPATRLHASWSPPPVGWLKCNVDAAIDDRSNTVSFGCCIRDPTGVFVKARTSWINATMTPAEAECWGLLQALSWIGELNLHSVFVEMDCQQVVLDVLKDKSARNEYGCLLSDCKTPF